MSDPGTFRVDLSTRFSNPRREVNLLVRQVLRCPGARQRRSREDQINDSRGPNVRELRDLQTLLSPEQVASLIAAYVQGVPVCELADRYNVHRTTVTEHARHHGLALCRRSLDEDERTTAAGLYEDGLTMSEIAEQFEVSTGAVRTALVIEGILIRPRGRRRRRVAIASPWAELTAPYKITRVADCADKISSMIQESAVTPDDVVLDLRDLTPDLFRAVEAGTQDGVLFFEEHERPIDPYLFPSIVRWKARVVLAEASISVEDDDECAVDEALPNNGILLRYRTYTIRLLKADHGQVPAPGPSRPRRDFWAQPLFGSTSFMNLIVIWDYDFETGEVTLDLACPRSAEAYGNVNLHFRRRLDHPVVTATATADDDTGDLNIRYRTSESAAETEAG